MDIPIVAAQCLIADMLHALGHRDDAQCHLTDAESMTSALVAALVFGGNQVVAAAFLREQGSMRRRLSRGRFCRRVHRNKDLFLTVFAVLAEHWNAVDPSMVDLIDSFPIASCDTIRIMRSRRYRGEAYRGYIASKRRYFYGLRRHLITTAAGQPVELFLVPGAENDTGALAWYQFDLPCGARIVGDKAFNVYAIAGDLAAIDIAVCPLRKKNSTRAIPAWKTNVRELQRK